MHYLYLYYNALYKEKQHRYRKSGNGAVLGVFQQKFQKKQFDNFKDLPV
jgi:hypothetical protein